jgi:predicted ArsR family transcriptional regulator
MDQKVVDTALRDASRIVADYFRSESRDVHKTIAKLSEVLDDQRFTAAVQRIDARLGGYSCRRLRRSDRKRT